MTRYKTLTVRGALRFPVKVRAAGRIRGERCAALDRMTDKLADRCDRRSSGYDTEAAILATDLDRLARGASADRKRRRKEAGIKGDGDPYARHKRKARKRAKRRAKHADVFAAIDFDAPTVPTFVKRPARKGDA